jgi:hypothetical protein
VAAVRALVSGLTLLPWVAAFGVPGGARAPSGTTVLQIAGAIDVATFGTPYLSRITDP